MSTGKVIADGVTGQGYSPAEARALLEETPDVPTFLRTTFSGYGCNMAVRMAPIREHKLTFDENLPLYGWQEDVDFSRQLARFGRVVQASQMFGVHLGHKAGRSSGVRFGYSQVANIWYLATEGTVSLRSGGRLAIRNILMNIVFSVQGNGPIDRRGRLKGNLLALLDLARGRCDPRRIREL